MSKLLVRALLVIFTVTFTASTGWSQDLEIGLTGGGMYYLGDLNPGQHFKGTNVAFGVIARYTLDTRWAVRLNAIYGKVKGDASTSSFLPERNLNFTSNVTDIGAVVEFNFLPYFTGSFKSSVSPYIYTGVSIFFYNPFSNGVSLRELGTEGQNIGFRDRSPYGSYGISVPFGVGGKFSLAKNLGIQVFWEIHKTFTDYLDDVSTTYYLVKGTDPENPVAGQMSDPTASYLPGMQRGNEKNQDWYAFFGVSVTYKFRLFSNNRCRDLYQ
jgi:hypothetical protein